MATSEPHRGLFDYNWHFGPLHIRRPIDRLGERWTVMLDLPGTHSWAAVIVRVTRAPRRVSIIQPALCWCGKHVF